MYRVGLLFRINWSIKILSGQECWGGRKGMFCRAPSTKCHCCNLMPSTKWRWFNHTLELDPYSCLVTSWPIQPYTEDWQGGRDKERTSSAEMVLRASVIADITEITRSNCSAQTYKPHANAILLQFRIRFGQVMVRVLFLLRCCRVKELV